MSKTKAALDEWCEQVAPTTELRRWYGHDPGRFAEFSRRYRNELGHGEQSGALAHLREISTNHTVTLLTASKDPSLSEVAILIDLLGSDPTGAQRWYGVIESYEPGSWLTLHGPYATPADAYRAAEMLLLPDRHVLQPRPERPVRRVREHCGHGQTRRR